MTKSITYFGDAGKDDDTKDLRACLNSGFKKDENLRAPERTNLEVKEFVTLPQSTVGYR